MPQYPQLSFDEELEVFFRFVALVCGFVTVIPVLPELLNFQLLVFSKVTLVRAVQPEKADFPMDLITAGMVMSLSDVQPEKAEELISIPSTYTEGLLVGRVTETRFSQFATFSTLRMVLGRMSERKLETLFRLYGG